MRKLSPKITALLLTGALLTTMPIADAKPPKHHRHSAKPVPSAQEARTARTRKIQIAQKLSGVHSRMHHVKAKIHFAAVKENQITETLETVQARLARTRSRLSAARDRLDRLDSQHDAIVERLTETTDRLAARRALLSKRVSENYQRGQVSYAQVLLASHSMHEMLSRGYYVRQIVASDTELIASVKDDIAQIQEDKQALEAQAREQEALAADYEAQQQQFSADKQREEQLLRGAQAEKAEAQDELDGLEEEADAMNDRIRQLSEMLLRRQEAERRARALTRRRRPPENHDDNGSDDEPAPVWSGGFMHPVSGRITSGFGYRFHPILHRRKLHTGTDFGVPYGTPIHAAGGGVVIYAAYNRGYGNCVIIDHGGGVTTLYGHCSALNVSEGETVSQGQVIGRVGSTGMSTGPHLHWEVRHNGVPVHP